MKLEYQDRVISLKDPSQYPSGELTELVQASERSAAGTFHVEDYEVTTGVFEYYFKDMSTEDYRKLLEFFVNDAHAQLNNFYLTDDLDVKRYVHFIQPKLRFKNTAFDLWTGSFSVELVN